MVTMVKTLCRALFKLIYTLWIPGIINYLGAGNNAIISFNYFLIDTS